MAAEPARQPAPTVGRGLGLAVGLCASPCVFGVYYASPYNPYPYLSTTAWGFVGLAGSVMLGLVAAGLARGPRLGPTAVGLLASVGPGLYIGLEAAALVPSDPAAALAIGLLATLIIGGATGFGAGITAQRERRRMPLLGCAGLGLALGASTGLYLSSVLFMPTVENAKQINLLVGGAIGLALGYAAARGGQDRAWLGRAGLGLAVGCCAGIWAYNVIHDFDGMFGQWAVWAVWPALGGAAGLAWAGRSGAGRLQLAAAGLAVGACTGASFASLTCLSTGCFKESSGISTWGLIGSLGGGALGVAIGALGYRTRLGSAALGLAIGAFVGDSAFIFNTGTYYQGSLDASELGWHLTVGVFGLVVGWLAGDAGGRPAAFGLGFGGWVGAWAGALAAHYAILPGGADGAGIVGMLAGGLVGLMICLPAGWLRFSSTALGVVVGAFVGARFGDPGGQSALRGITGMIIGGGLGLILCWRGERALIAAVPGLAVGAVVGAWAGAAVLAFPVPASPTTTSLICMTAGGLVGLMYVHGCRLIMAGRFLALAGPTRHVNPTAWPDARLDRLTALSRWLVSLAAAHAASGTLETCHKRYAEEFDSTLKIITGRLAPLRRLRCAISILIGALTLRIELEDDEDKA
jgi:hypothetical protein